MDLEYLKELLAIFDKSTATEISLEEEGTKIKVSKKDGKITAITQPNMQVTMPTSAHDSAITSAPIVPLVDSNEDLHQITSPIVGTFYSAPSPDSPSFVTIGQKVEAGQTLCIVEAMKLMNEIESDVSGTVEKILIKNAQPVEYGEVLFLIKKD